MQFFKSKNGHVYHQPENIDDVKKLVIQARNDTKVIVVQGAGHSFPLSDQLTRQAGNYLYVLLTYLNKINNYDWGQGVFTVEAGCRIGHDPFDETDVSTLENSLVYQLDPVNANGTRSLPPGWSLPELGGITHQTIGGFIATGSSGGSTKFAFCDAIQSVRLIYHNEQNLVDRTFTRGVDEEFFCGRVCQPGPVRYTG